MNTFIVICNNAPDFDDYSTVPNEQGARNKQGRGEFAIFLTYPRDMGQAFKVNTCFLSFHGVIQTILHERTFKTLYFKKVSQNFASKTPKINKRGGALIRHRRVSYYIYSLYPHYCFITFTYSTVPNKRTPPLITFCDLRS